MYGVNAKLPRKYYKCEMCYNTKMQDCYIWGNFAMPPKHSYKEYEICKKCALRENGKRKNLDYKITERTRQWLQKKSQ